MIAEIVKLYANELMNIKECLLECLPEMFAQNI